MDFSIAAKDSVIGCWLFVPVLYGALVPVLLIPDSLLILLFCAHFLYHLNVLWIQLVIPHLSDGGIFIAFLIFTFCFYSANFAKTFGYHI